VVEKLNVGELEVWVESGPYASIAAVIRGVGPPQLRTRLAETLELIHRNYSAEMERFAGETAGFAPVVELLSALLDSAYQQKPPPRAKPYAWVLLGVVLLALAGWLSLRWWQGRQWSRLARTLESEPGIVITGFGRQGGHLLVRGLRDPLARDPADLLRAAGLTDRQAEFHWNSYYALDDPIVRKRAMVLLEPPASVSLDAQDGVLVVSGEAPRPWIDKLREARLIAGVRRVDLSRLADLDEAEFRRAKAAIEATVLRFPVGSSEILSDAREELASLFPQFVELTKRSSVLHRPFAVEIIGHSDSSGAEATNRPLSQSRAERVRRQLAGQGLDLKRMQAKGVAATEPLRNEENEEARQYNRSVTIRIVPLGTPQL